jgi:hypothetical protein
MLDLLGQMLSWGERMAIGRWFKLSGTWSSPGGLMSTFLELMKPP